MITYGRIAQELRDAATRLDVRGSDGMPSEEIFELSDVLVLKLAELCEFRQREEQRDERRTGCD